MRRVDSATGNNANLRFQGTNASSAATTLAEISVDQDTATAGAEDGSLRIRTTRGGAAANRVHIDAGMYMDGATGSDPGSGKFNASGLQDDGIDLKPHVQDATDADSAVATGTTVMPDDDTIPQNTEGDEYLAVTITPKATSNILDIVAVVYAATTAGNHIVAGLFQDSTANALKAGIAYNAANNRAQKIVLKHRMTAGTTSATTFKVRIGPSAAGTVTFNGESSARLLGGVMSSFIYVREFIP
jgi:hypothetical protein